ncbi:MAG: Kelch repeat-containing protein, partial [Actinomycetota bacterium]
MKAKTAKRNAATAATIVAAVLFTAASALAGRAALWSKAASASVPRADGFSATILNDGRVLLAGGSGANIAMKDAEIFDPSKGSWTPAASMIEGRSQHSATLLPDGRVLLVGGGSEKGFQEPLAGAELYDPKANKWTASAALPVGMYAQTATLLKDGRVLIAGGRNAGHAPALARCWLFDPSSGAWTETGSLAVGRTEHTATLLADGKVLAAGGRLGGHDPSFKDASIFDPAAGSWTPVPSFMAEGRAAHTATLLDDGRVLIAGGTKEFIGGHLEYVLSTSEI